MIIILFSIKEKKSKIENYDIFTAFSIINQERLELYLYYQHQG